MNQVLYITVFHWAVYNGVPLGWVVGPRHVKVTISCLAALAVASAVSDVASGAYLHLDTNSAPIPCIWC